jgi:uncharacterized protein (DUF2062 family)
MPRKTLKKILPHHSKVTGNPMIQKLGPRLKDPGLWHINRHSVSGAVAVGLFTAFIPVPFQMFIAAVGAVLFRVNILISVALVWISNPLTMPPLFYFCYRVGLWILGQPADYQAFDFELSFEWLLHELRYIWQPFLLGCLVVGSGTAAIGYAAVRGLWRYHLVRHIQQRRQRHLR